MAKGKKPKRRNIQTPIGNKTRAEIKKYSKYMPSLKEMSKKRHLSSSEMGKLTRARKRLRHTENLRPVTEKQAKILKKRKLLAGNGIQAIRLNNTSPNAKIRLRKNGVLVSSNGRTWEYHSVLITMEDMIDAGEALLERGDIAQINLWTTKGRGNEGFAYAEAWANYLREYWQKYESQEDFMNGIAALVSEREIKTKEKTPQATAKKTAEKEQSALKKNKKSKRKPSKRDGK